MKAFENHGEDLAINSPWARFGRPRDGAGRCFLALAVAAVLFGGCASRGTQRAAEHYVDDQVTTERVRQALSQQPDHARIQVTTTNAVVYLSGAVSTAEAKAQAAASARRVYPVKEVRNDLAVQAAPKR